MGQLLWQKEVGNQKCSKLESRNEATQKTGGNMRQSKGQKGEVWPEEVGDPFAEALNTPPSFYLFLGISTIVLTLCMYLMFTPKGLS